MATPFTDTPKVGPSLRTIDTAAQLADGTANGSSHRLGSQIWANDGKRYVYAQANATIAASTAVATVNATTFLATASGGAYTSPPVAMATGDRGWFAAASV